MSVSLTQYANLGTSLTPPGWQTGNLNSGNARYREGDSIPYRIVFSGLTVGQTYKVTIDYPTTVSGNHAIDYLTSYNRTLTAVDPCAGVACTGPTSSLPIPADANVTSAGVSQLTGQSFTLFGGTFVAAPATFAAGTVGNLCTAYPCTVNDNPSPYALNGSYAGTSDTRVDVYVVAGSPTVVLAWGGHVATRADWGVGKSIIYTSGAAYHMSLQGFACQDTPNCGTGSQDRSLGASAVVFPASLTVVKHADVQGELAFPFNASPAPLTDFTLVEDGTAANTVTFGGVVSFTTYLVTETTSTVWFLSGAECKAQVSNGGSATVSGTTAAVRVANGEDWTCTFTNTLSAPALSLGQAVSPGTYSHTGDTIHFTYFVTNTGNVTLQGPFTVDSDLTPVSCPTTASLAPGAAMQCSATYTVTQADLDAGSVTNSATAGGSYAGQVVTSDAAQATATAVQSPHLALAAGASPTTYWIEGQVIGFTFVATNTGNVTLQGPLTVNALLWSGAMANAGNNASGGTSADVSCPLTGSLAPGQAMQCTTSHTVTYDDVTAGAVTSTATASASFGGSAVVSNQAQAGAALKRYTAFFPIVIK